MPSLIRFLITLAVLAGIAYGAMVALVMFVQPNEREISVRVPTDQLKLERIAPPVSAPAVLQEEESADQ